MDNEQIVYIPSEAAKQLNLKEVLLVIMLVSSKMKVLISREIVKKHRTFLTQYLLAIENMLEYRRLL